MPAPAKATDGSQGDQTLSALMAMVRRLENKVEEQHSKNAKLAKQAAQALMTEQLANDRLEREYEQSLSARQEAEIAALQAELEAAKAPKPASKFEDPEFSSRLETLMRTGQYTLQEVITALENTKQDGKYSSTRADAHLKAIQQSSRQDARKQANASLEDAHVSIAEGSSLARILSTCGNNENAIAIVVKLKDVHARRATKASHSAVPAIAASNLLQTPVIKNDAQMSKEGLGFLSQVAAAVCEDCEQCQEQRKTKEAQDKWKASQAEAAASKAKLAKERSAAKRHTLPFKTCDSRRDKTKTHGLCGECEKGKKGGKWLYFCEDKCGRGYHVLCVTWKHIRLTHGGRNTWFACHRCIEARDRAVAEGNDAQAYEEVDEEVEHGLAPLSAEASEDSPGDDETPAGKETDGRGGHDDPHPAAPQTNQPRRLAALTTPPATPTSSSLLQLYGGGGYPPRVKPGFELDPSNTPGPVGSGISTGNKANLGMNVKDYFMWHAVPKDWAPKPIPGAKADTAKVPTTHPECGYSKTAYQNWRRKNVTQRDLVAAQGSTLGPLVRGISAEMKVSIGRQFLREPELKMLWPKQSMTDADIDRWVLEDPDYKWVDRIPDDILLSLLDRRFGVRKPDLFLSRKFYEDLPTTDEHGDVNYHADQFNRWATEWTAELTELQKSGCDLSHVDLRQTLLTAVSTYKLIHREALQYNTQSANLLLAHLCDWVYQEEENILSARNKRASLVESKPSTCQPQADPSTQRSPTQPKAGGGATQSKNTAHALLTTLNDAITAQLSAEGGNGAQQGARPYPSWLKPTSDGTRVNCRGCNNNWVKDKTRSIPCFTGCKYAEHPDYNKECKHKDGKQYPALTWQNFRTLFPSVTPPPSFLKWEAWQQKNKTPNNKRPREDSA